MKIHAVVVGRQGKKTVFQFPTQGGSRRGTKEPGGFRFRQRDQVFTVLKRRAAPGHGTGAFRKRKLPACSLHESHGFGNGGTHLLQTVFPNGRVHASPMRVS